LAVDKARELGVWIVENNKERVALEEVLRTGQGGGGGVGFIVLFQPVGLLMTRKY